MRASRGLKWENKMYQLRRSIKELSLSFSQTNLSFPTVLRFSESIKGGFLKYLTQKMKKKNSAKIHQIIEKNKKHFKERFFHL